MDKSGIWLGSPYKIWDYIYLDTFNYSILKTCKESTKSV